ncbi:hypothetical protein GCM10009789_03730 [Kribbella sancticallisti]|uniref:Zinc finger DksA/TraR C4-type domain-containing protein n=2 Tax=Kribbella sancticallisti TaxID=460087 RepID=A0ABN2C6Y5_9ACTN
MTQVSQAVAPDGRDSRGNWDDVFQAELEQQRQFRVEQLADLTSDRLAVGDGSLDEVTSALLTAAAAALHDIDAALERIKSGCFGLCQHCGQVIALERLRALPMASLCMDCQYANEATGSGTLGGVPAEYLTCEAKRGAGHHR